MKEVTFLYRDEGTGGEWRERQCRVESARQAIDLYGLGTDCDYMMVSVRDVESGSFDYAWLREAEDLDGGVPLVDTGGEPGLDPEDLDEAEAAATLAVCEELDGEAALSPLIARVRRADPLGEDVPDEFRLVSGDPAVLESLGPLAYPSVRELLESMCDLKNGVVPCEVCGGAVQLEATGAGYLENTPGSPEAWHNVTQLVQLRRIDGDWAHQFGTDFMTPRLEAMFGAVGQVIPAPGLVERCREAATGAWDGVMRQSERRVPEAELLSERMTAALEEAGWAVNTCGEGPDAGLIELERWTELTGCDMLVYIDMRDLDVESPSDWRRAIEETVDSFDVDEEVARHMGMRGAPGVSAIVDDFRGFEETHLLPLVDTVAGVASSWERERGLPGPCPRHGPEADRGAAEER